MAVKRTNDPAFSGHIASTAPTLNPAGDWSVYGWVKFVTSVNTKGFWSCGDGADFFGLRSDATGKLQLRGHPGTNRITSAADVFTTGVWYWVAITKSGNTVTVYLGDESTPASSIGSGDSSTWATPLFTADGQRFFGLRGEGDQLGQDSEMAYWRSHNGTALDLTQLRAEQYKKSAVVTTNLRAEYDFASAAARATDSSSNAFSLTDGASTTWADGTDPSGLSEPVSGPTGGNPTPQDFGQQRRRFPRRQGGMSWPLNVREWW